MKPRVVTEWSPQLAYAVGLIASDGCLYSDGRHVSFTSKDLQLAETFLTCLGSEAKIGTKRRGGGGTTAYFHVQIGDVRFYRWLESIGLTPRKSKALGALKVPDDLFFDFLRGSFDGDGTCYSYFDPRWTRSFCIRLGFYSASSTHIEWIRQKILQLSKQVGSLGFSAKVWSIRYGKNAAIELRNRMYYSDEVPCLLRKRKKLDSACNNVDP